MPRSAASPTSRRIVRLVLITACAIPIALVAIVVLIAGSRADRSR